MRYYGCVRPKHVDKFARKFLHTQAMLAALPAKVDLDSPMLPPPFDPAVDQGQLGACGPNCLQEQMAFLFWAAGLAVPVPAASRLAMYYLTRAAMGTVSQDSGVDNQTMMATVERTGWPDESLDPYNVAAFTQPPSAAAMAQAAKRVGVVRPSNVPQSIDSIRASIANKQPVLVGFTVYSSFESQTVATSGVVPLPKRGEQILGGHDNLAIGYDDATQKIKTRNPWGPDFGDHGNLYFDYAYFTDPSLSGDFWNAALDPSVVPSPVPTPSPAPAPSPTTRLIEVDGATKILIDGRQV